MTMQANYTIVVFLDATGCPVTVRIGNVPKDAVADVAQEGIEALAEEDPMLALLTTNIHVIPADGDLDVLTYHFDVLNHIGYTVRRS